MNFVPALHFKPQSKKLTREWCDEVVQYYVYQTHQINLLQDKNIGEIEGFASGDYSMREFKKLFKSLRVQMTMEGNPNISKETIDKLDKTGLNWERVPILAPKLNSAVATTQKIPLEITCVCNDPLAQKKKKEDLEFLRNKPKMEAELQPLYDSLNLGEVDMGTTKYASVPYTTLPLDLDVMDDQEFLLFANLIYNLAPEAAFETILNLYTEIKRINQIRLLETKDQYKYAVSANRVIIDKMTGLPDVEYIYPGSVTTDGSQLPDYSDNIIRIINKRVTPLELFKYFPSEICNEDQLEQIVGNTHDANDWNSGYCYCNNQQGITKNEWNTFRMNLDYIEVKSVDSAMIANKPKSKHQYFTNEETECADRIWGQNTYCFYWLRHTKYFLGIDKLDYAYRKKGQERYQSFSSCINKSQHKSAVELSIGENKKAQIADIKLQHAIIMSMPTGKVIDIKYMRNVVEGLSGESTMYSEKELLEMAMEKNIHIIDTQGFENTKEGAFTPVRDLPGGLKAEVEGYYRVLLEADAKISQYTNINNQLTGQSANPEGLVGLQKLLINSSINGLYYVHEALLAQYTGVYTLLANLLKACIEKGGAPRKAIEAQIGNNKVEIIDAMEDLTIHDIGVTIKLGQREEERAQFQLEVENMRKEGKIDAAGKYYILNTKNPKDAMLLAATFERKFNKRQDAIRQEQLAANQQVVEQQGQNVIANTQAQTDGKMAEIREEAKAEAALMQLGNQLGLTQKQIDGLIKRSLQKDRIDGQIDKSLKTLYAKSNLEKQEPIPA